jgi:hypothetical protein
MEPELHLEFPGYISLCYYSVKSLYRQEVNTVCSNHME